VVLTARITGRLRQKKVFHGNPQAVSDPESGVGRNMASLTSDQPPDMAVRLVASRGSQPTVTDTLHDHQPFELLVVFQDHRHLLR
jgi:hypothetical protein